MRNKFVHTKDFSESIITLIKNNIHLVGKIEAVRENLYFFEIQKAQFILESCDDDTAKYLFIVLKKNEEDIRDSETARFFPPRLPYTNSSDLPEDTNPELDIIAKKLYDTYESRIDLSLRNKLLSD